MWLAPSDPGPFQALTQRVVEAFPAYPPYGGDFADSVPHLTIGDSQPAGDLRAAEESIAPLLPIIGEATAVTLITQESPAARSAGPPPSPWPETAPIAVRFVVPFLRAIRTGNPVTISLTHPNAPPGQPLRNARIVDAEHAPGVQREAPLDVLARPAPPGRQVQAVREVRRVQRPHQAQVVTIPFRHGTSVGRGGIARRNRFVLKESHPSRAAVMAARPSASRPGGS